MSILDDIAAATRQRTEDAKKSAPIGTIREKAYASPPPKDFAAALSGPGVSFICEIKKASPSKGVISPGFPYLALAEQYEKGGAAAVSCLTEPQWFLGSDQIFSEVRSQVSIPMIRKDFTVDPYQIWEARALGADAVLLICALLDADTLARYLELAHELGMAALVEAHDEAEIQQAAAAGARIIGVNNRNLRDFSVDFDNAARLRDLIPPECLYVAESGVSSPEDAAVLARIGADAVLMGEVLMRSDDPASLLREMREATRTASEQGGSFCRRLHEN